VGESVPPTGDATAPLSSSAMYEEYSINNDSMYTELLALDCGITSFDAMYDAKSITMLSVMLSP
jgi:hypothetical protein